MKKNTIKKKVINRLLGEEYPQDVLLALLDVDERAHLEFGVTERMREVFPFVFSEENIEMEKIKEFRKEVKKQLIKEINRLAEKNASYYDIGILILALFNLTDSFKKLNKKDPKIYFSCNYVQMVVSSNTNIKEGMQYLKVFDLFKSF